jgi:hypothetical protein
MDYGHFSDDEKRMDIGHIVDTPLMMRIEILSLVLSDTLFVRPGKIKERVPLKKY